MLGIKTKVVKNRRTMKKLDKQAKDRGVLGMTGNPYVQTKDRMKDNGVTSVDPMLNEFERRGL